MDARARLGARLFAALILHVVSSAGASLWLVPGDACGTVVVKTDSRGAAGIQLRAPGEAWSAPLIGTSTSYTALSGAYTSPSILSVPVPDLVWPAVYTYRVVDGQGTPLPQGEGHVGGATQPDRPSSPWALNGTVAAPWCDPPPSGMQSPLSSTAAAFPPAAVAVGARLVVVGDPGQTAHSAAVLGAAAAEAADANATCSDTRSPQACALPGYAGLPLPVSVTIAGDLSYADGDPSRWDSWQGMVDGTGLAGGSGSATPGRGPASSAPLHVLPGNHETVWSDDWTAYRARWGQQGQGQGQGQGRGLQEQGERSVAGDSPSPFPSCALASSLSLPSVYHTWAVGPVRVVALSSYTSTARRRSRSRRRGLGSWDGGRSGSSRSTVAEGEAGKMGEQPSGVSAGITPPSQGDRQYRFLQAALACGNEERAGAARVFLVVLMHGPLYSSNTIHHGEGEGLRQVWEPLLVGAGVDLVLAGHVHSVETSTPVVDGRPDPSGPVYVTTGHGGNREGLYNAFITPTPAWSVSRGSTAWGYTVVEAAAWNGSMAGTAGTAGTAGAAAGATPTATTPGMADAALSVAAAGLRVRVMGVVRAPEGQAAAAQPEPPTPFPLYTLAVASQALRRGLLPNATATGGGSSGGADEDSGAPDSPGLTAGRVVMGAIVSTSLLCSCGLLCYECCKPPRRLGTTASAAAEARLGPGATAMGVEGGQAASVFSFPRLSRGRLSLPMALPLPFGSSSWRRLGSERDHPGGESGGSAGVPSGGSAGTAAAGSDDGDGDGDDAHVDLQVVTEEDEEEEDGGKGPRGSGKGGEARREGGRVQVGRPHHVAAGRPPGQLQQRHDEEPEDDDIGLVPRR